MLLKKKQLTLCYRFILVKLHEFLSKDWQTDISQYTQTVSFLHGLKILSSGRALWCTPSSMLRTSGFPNRRDVNKSKHVFSNNECPEQQSMCFTQQTVPFNAKTHSSQTKYKPHSKEKEERIRKKKDFIMLSTGRAKIKTSPWIFALVTADRQAHNKKTYSLLYWRRINSTAKQLQAYLLYSKAGHWRTELHNNVTLHVDWSVRSDVMCVYFCPVLVSDQNTLKACQAFWVTPGTVPLLCTQGVLHNVF